MNSEIVEAVFPETIKPQVIRETTPYNREVRRKMVKRGLIDRPKPKGFGEL